MFDGGGLIRKYSLVPRPNEALRCGSLKPDPQELTIEFEIVDVFDVGFVPL